MDRSRNYGNVTMNAVGYDNGFHQCHVEGEGWGLIRI